MLKSEIHTPALLVDMDAMEANLEKMAAFFAAGPTRLRPHYKNHKCVALARRQLAAGAIGITCATLGEAEVLATNGIHGLLLANEIAGAPQMERLLQVARLTDIMVGVDNERTIAALAAASARANVPLHVVVDVNTGLGRGEPLMAPGQPALAMAQLAVSAGLNFRGLIGYEGHCVRLAPGPAKVEVAQQAMDRLVRHSRLGRSLIRSSNRRLWPQGNLGMSCCKNAGSGRASAKAPLYRRFRGRIKSRTFRGSDNPLSASIIIRMQLNAFRSACFLCALSTFAGHPLPAQQGPAPHLEKRGESTQLVVDGKPFLMLGGELFNSSSSSLDYMKPIWPRLAAMSLNTVFTPLSWEMVEPTEGQYDFSLIDGLLSQAREQRLHVVFLWLAAWKNGVSSYPPVWVRQNTERFPRAVLNGSASTTLSTLAVNSGELRQADSMAFAAVMKHIKQVDATEHTVLMMQIENEVGVLTDTRDHSAAADKAFASPVPPPLMTYLQAHRESLNPELRALWLSNGEKSSGTWADVFGDSSRADEIFMAWQYGLYVQAVTAAGKAVYPLPMYANAWLGGGDARPGMYPSGGPQPRVIDIWKAAGTALDVFAPDLYQSNFAEWAKQYHRPDNPLLLAETNGGAQGAAWVFYAVGEQSALAFSPFAIDAGLNAAAADATDERLINLRKRNADLGESYAAVAAVTPSLLEQQAKGNTHGFNLTRQHPSVEFTMGGLSLQVSLDQVFGNQAESGYGLIMMTKQPGPSGEAEFLGAGKGFRVIVTSRTQGKHVSLASVDDGKFVEGRWAPGRRLNGDETDQGAAWRFDSRAMHTEKATVFLW